MKIPRLLNLIAPLLLGMAAHLCAQTLPNDWDAVKGLPAGTDVRIRTASRTVKVRVDRVNGDALMALTGGRPETFDRQQVSAVWVKKAGHRRRNALIGLGVGAGVGLGIGLASRTSGFQFIPNSAVVAAVTVACAIVGTVVGVAIPSGGWRRIYSKSP